MRLESREAGAPQRTPEPLLWSSRRAVEIDHGPDRRDDLFRGAQDIQDPLAEEGVPSELAACVQTVSLVSDPHGIGRARLDAVAAPDAAVEVNGDDPPVRGAVDYV